MTIPDLEAKAVEIRKKILQLSLTHDYGHIPSALSCVEILVALYYEVMEENDVFIMSKGHGALALYAILEDLYPLPKRKRDFSGCIERDISWGIPASTGSLGHGLPFAVGIALAKRLKQQPGRVYCLVGDAEEQEGSIQEGYGLIVDRRLTNMRVIVDVNRFGAMQRVSNLAGGYPGHDFGPLLNYLQMDLPRLRCVTQKGKGVPFMQGEAEYHYRPPSCMTKEERQWLQTYVASSNKA